MNAIDDIGQKVGVSREMSHPRGIGRSIEPDHEYALRVLEKLYRTYRSVNAEGWTADQETNDYELHTHDGSAYITRGKGSWLYIAYLKNGGAVSSVAVEGTARYLEKAMQICSLALSP